MESHLRPVPVPALSCTPPAAARPGLGQGPHPTTGVLVSPTHAELERNGTPPGGLGCCQERQARQGPGHHTASSLGLGSCRPVSGASTVNTEPLFTMRCQPTLLSREQRQQRQHDVRGQQTGARFRWESEFCQNLSCPRPSAHARTPLRGLSQPRPRAAPGPQRPGLQQAPWLAPRCSASTLPRGGLTQRSVLEARIQLLEVGNTSARLPEGQEGLTGISHLPRSPHLELGQWGG